MVTARPAVGPIDTEVCKFADLQCVYDTRDITQDRQEDVDEEVCIAAALEEDAERWKEDGENDFADVAVEDSRISYTGPNKTQKIWGWQLSNRCRCRTHPRSS